MYIFHTLHKNLAKLHSEPDITLEICCGTKTGMVHVDKLPQLFCPIMLESGPNLIAA